MAYIELKDAGYEYAKGGFSISGINLELNKEEFTAIIGPNGGGKTTLGKIAAGIFKPCHGEVLICGKNSKNMSLGKIGHHIGYLFQNPDRQIFASTVREQISFPLDIFGMKKDEINKRTDEILELFNLKELENSLPFKLSRGEKQRLVIASILIISPEFLILDEPTTGLDVERKDTLSDMLDKLLKLGIGIAVISHDEEFIDKHADRIIRVSGGRIENDTRI